MTAASPGPGPNIFSILSGENDGLYRARRETFFCSLLGQAAIVGLLIYFTSCVIRSTPEIARQLPKFIELPLVFSGHNGGAGAATMTRFRPRTAISPRPRSILNAASDRDSPEGTAEACGGRRRWGWRRTFLCRRAGRLAIPCRSFLCYPTDRAVPGDRARMLRWRRPVNRARSRPRAAGNFSGGKKGVTVPQVIFQPEPSFSDEARKAKAQGIVLLLLVVGKDGHPYDIRVGQSLGMGLDEKAIEAVNRWRFRPATLNGQPVATQIAVQVDFHLY